MKKGIYYAILALVLGAACFGLRRWQMATDFDALGLPVPGAATWALAGVATLSLALFVALLLPLKGASRWDAVLGERKLTPLYGGAALFAAALVPLLRLRGGEIDDVAVFVVAAKVIPVLMAVGTVLTAVGLCFAAAGGALRGQYLVMPTLFGCFWTVGAYHDHGTDPVIGHFLWLILAVVSSTMAWYELTGLSMNRGHARRAFFLCLCTVLFSLTALAGGVSLPEMLLLAAQTVSLFTVALAMGQGFRENGEQESETE